MKNSRNVKLNEMLNIVKFEKQYIKKLKEKFNWLSILKETDYKTVGYKIFSHRFKKFSSNLIYEKERLPSQKNSVIFIVSITYTKKNTFLHVTDFSGKLLFFKSAGMFNSKGKFNKFRIIALRNFYKSIVSKLGSIKNKPIALHLKGVGLAWPYIVRDLRKKFFIRVVKLFSLAPHNGCRGKKLRRKKFRTKKLKKFKEKWLSG